ncbi:MAG TPA: single-stranded-DNA-specific exonuclease RecJ [Deltaproteobacteria bacterium]|nr:single-stranded-DNA-specific exonuclease RecJ [Deltaproteobacteria bacterium]
MVCTAPQWVIRGHVDDHALPSLNFTPVFRSLMRCRGMHDPAEVMDFLTPNLGQLRDPRSMKGMERACSRIVEAINRKENIGVFTDYDVDGVCSAALIHRFMTGLGCDPPAVFIPDRTSDGYGLNTRGIDELHARGVTLLITADCGITAHQEVDYANSLGMDVIVTDHHEVDGPVPDAYSVINPKQSDCLFCGEDLCGTGVVYHLIIALRSLLRERGVANLPNLKGELDIVAMATVADAVALSGLNRILVKEGLSVLNSSMRVGLSALSRVAGIKKELMSRDLGYILGPRINAAGRISDARNAFDLLTTEDPGQAQRLAVELDGLNRKRQMHEQRVLEMALEQLRDSPPMENVTVVWGRDWHIGVLGIVASRLVNLLARPALVISVMDGMGIGSGRSLPGIDLHRALSGAAAVLAGFGGHKMAVGLSVPEERITVLPGMLNEAVASQMETRQNTFDVDLRISPYDLSPALLQELELLAPYGEGNPEPVFLIPAMEVVSRKDFGDGQAKFILKHSNRVFHTLKSPVGPHLGDASKYLDVAFTPVRLRINGHSYLYLSVKAMAMSR